MPSSNNCSERPKPLEAYGDITGLGVVLGFLITAWLTVIVLITNYLLIFDPRKNPYRKTADRGRQSRVSSRTPNPVDMTVYKSMERLRNSLLRHRQEVSVGEEAFQKCILALADTQLITGISVLVSAYYTLTQGLSAYHWQMIIYLAWFSSMTHLSALTFLRTYFANHPAGRLWRVLIMSLLVILLFIGLIPTGHFNFISKVWTVASKVDFGDFVYPNDCDDFGQIGSQYFGCWLPNNATGFTDFDDNGYRSGTCGPKLCTVAGKPLSEYQPTNDDTLRRLWIPDPMLHPETVDWQVILPESPARCYLKGGMPRTSSTFTSLIISLLLLAYSFLLRVIKTFERSNEVLSFISHKRLYHLFQGVAQTWRQKLRQVGPKVSLLMTSVLLPFQNSVYFTFYVFLHLYTSVLAEVVGITISALWGTARLSSTRGLGNPGDNDWTFGQVIPIVLLSSPLVYVFELAYKSGPPKDWSFRMTPATPAQAPEVTQENARNSTVPESIEMEESLNCSLLREGLGRENPQSEDNVTGLRMPVPSITANWNEVSNHSHLRLQPSSFTQQNSLTGTLQSYSYVDSLIADLIKEPNKLHEEIWRKSLFSIMLGPTVAIPFRILSVAFAGLEIENRTLVDVLITAACLLVIIQTYIYFLFYVRRIKSLKTRKSLMIVLVLILAVYGIALSMLVMFGQRLLLGWIVAATYTLQFITSLVAAAHRIYIFNQNRARILVVFE
ncbi:hypothetical protein EsH8_XIV_000029 [Colletotrichum jinshuiense]